MARVKVTVVHPTERLDNTPGVVSTWRVETKLAAATDWSPLGGTRPAAETELFVDNVPGPSLIMFRAFWTDPEGQESDPNETMLEIEPPAPPSRLKPGSISAAVVA